MTRYVGILDCSDGTWGVRIPDLPGCHGAGKSHQAAMADASSALREWISHQRSRGSAIPEPRTVEAVLADPASGFNSENEAVVMISMDRKKRRLPKARAADRAA